MTDARTIGGYRLDQQLGEGATAIVYRGVRLEDDAPVALKLLHPDLAIEPEVQERFRREARALSGVQHPNIVRFLDFVEEPPQFLFVMELLEGGTLEEFLRAKGSGLGEERALRWTLQLAEGLAAAHSKGVIHRDIKPANIFITFTDRVVLSDFGLAKPEGDNLTRAGTKMIGTPLYMAPEQITGRTATPATDVYQLAISCFEMLTGHLPFQGDNDYDRMIARIDVDMDLPDEVGASEPMRQILSRAGRKDPDLRYPDAGALAEDLRAAQEGHPLPWTPPRAEDADSVGIAMDSADALPAAPPAPDESWKDPAGYEGTRLVCPRVHLEYDPAGRAFLIGSDPHAEVFLDSAEIAPRQLRVRPQGREWWIETGNFQADAFVDGERLSAGSRPLPSGAVLALAGYEMLWVHHPEPEEDPEPGVEIPGGVEAPPRDSVDPAPATKAGCLPCALALGTVGWALVGLLGILGGLPLP